jgi:hypothetical protein
MNNWAWLVSGGMNAVAVAVLVMLGWRLHRRVRFAAVKAAQAERMAKSALVRLDLHAEVLPVGAVSANRPTQLGLSVVTRDV